MHVAVAVATFLPCPQMRWSWLSFLPLKVGLGRWFGDNFFSAQKVRGQVELEATGLCGSILSLTAAPWA